MVVDDVEPVELLSPCSRLLFVFFVLDCGNLTALLYARYKT
jgi:hypothetical protein